MRGLHSIHEPPPSWTWRWYYARQQRRGRRHLIKVPVYAVDLQAIVTSPRVPYNIRYMTADERQEWVNNRTRRHRNIVVPHTVNADEGPANRLCNGEQENRWYEIAPTPIDGIERPRGFCATCWRSWLNDPSIRSSMVQTQWAHNIGYLNTDMQNWKDVAQRDYRPR